MPKKKIATGAEKGYIGDKATTKAKPKEYVQDPRITEYIRLRNKDWMENLFIPQETKDEIIKVYGHLL